MIESDLIVGRFYWVLINTDVETEDEWVNDPMPARFAGIINGKPHWNYLNVGLSDWPVQWVGTEIVEAD